MPIAHIAWAMNNPLMTNAKTVTITTVDMPNGWYAKTMLSCAREHGPYRTKAAAIAAVKATGANVGVQGLKAWVHRGGLMTVARVA